jgi:hypothetical protein
VYNGLVSGCFTRLSRTAIPCRGVGNVFNDDGIRRSKMLKEEFVVQYILARASALESMDSARVVEAAFRAWDLVQEKLSNPV